MKSFKKIALAMVAAMTMGTAVVAPANAAPMTVALTVNNAAPATAGTSVATAIAIPVPSDNVINALDTVKFVATVDAGTSVSVSATNATIVTDVASPTAPVTASSGSSSLTVATGTGTTATFYVYTKTTAVGTVTVTNQGTTFTYYVQGQAGKINKLTASAPTSAPANTQQSVTVLATDVFGNKVAGKFISGRVFGGQGALETASVVTGSTLSDFGVATFKLTLPSTGRSLVEFSLTTASDGATAVVNLEAPSLTPFIEVSVRDLAAELAKVQAELVAEKAARAADKTAADAATAAAKLASDKALADAVKAEQDKAAAAVKAEQDKAATAALAAKAVADKALADAIAKATADAATAKAASDKAIADLKTAFNKLARQWNAKNPKARVSLIK